MSGRDKLYINRMRDKLNFIERVLEDISKDDFLENDVIQHAISMALISIGECANRLSAEFKEEHPDIEWVKIAAVRNIAVHGYWELNVEQVWRNTEKNIPELIKFFNNL